MVGVPWFVYVGFIGFVVVALFASFKLYRTDAGADAHGPPTAKSARWVAAWTGLALTFGAGILVWRGPEVAGEYLTAYVVEYALSVDNMFVFLLLFDAFEVPLDHRHRLLFFGVVGALLFRGAVIAAGAALLGAFHWVVYLFGALLLYTAYRVARGGQQSQRPQDNPVLRFFRQHFPTTTRFDGAKFLTTEGGQRVATPMLLALLAIETTDIVFALDSIPAVFGVTQRPFIVLTSNVFAVLGLRSLYFLLAGMLRHLRLLHYGLAIVLAFVGTKMLLGAVGVEVPIWLTFAVIVLAIGTTAVLSRLLP